MAQITTGGGSSSASGGGLDQTINPMSAAYGAKFDAQFTYQAIFTLNGTTITCSVGDCNFQTTAKPGQIVFAYESPISVNFGTSSFVTLLAQTTIATVNSNTSITVNGPGALAACNNPSNAMCILAWGTQDDTAAINAAITAAWSTPGSCKAVQFPSGNFFFSGPWANVAGSALSYPCGGYTTANGPSSSGVDTNQTGPELYGQGPGNTVGIPLPSFNYAGCTFGASGHACIGSSPNLEMHDIGINGLGQASVTGNPLINLVELDGSPYGGVCSGSTGFNLTFANWALLDPNALGFDFGRNACGDPTYFNVVSEMFGSITCNANSAGIVMQITGFACFGGNNATANNEFTLANANGVTGVINSTGSYYGQQMAAGGATVLVTGTGGILNSSGDFMQCFFANSCTVFRTGCSSGVCTINLTGDSLGVNPGATAGAVFFLNSAFTVVHVRNTIAAARGSEQLLVSISGANFFDDGGNTFTNGAANSISGGFFGSYSVTGTTLVAGNVVPSAGWGTTATVTAPSGDSHLFTFTVNSSGTGQAASPTLAVTFPTPYLVAPGCSAIQIGGTGAIADLTTTTGPSATTVTLTWNATPATGLNYIIQGRCQ